jgi:hypothetical protein
MTDKTAESTYEELEIRCPKLGGPVTFSYCKIEEQGRPCPRSLKCWVSYFDVEGVFRETLSPEEFDQCFRRPPPTRIGTLLELIEKAKKLTETETSEDTPGPVIPGPKDR